MSVSRDDFSIAFRSALLQRGATQKFSIFSLIVVALVVFFLDVYGFTVVKKTRSFINDVVYRVTYLASAPTRLFPEINQGISSHFNLKKENEELRQVIERYKALELNLEYINRGYEGSGVLYALHCMSKDLGDYQEGDVVIIQMSYPERKYSHLNEFKNTHSHLRHTELIDRTPEWIGPERTWELESTLIRSLFKAFQKIGVRFYYWITVDLPPQYNLEEFSKNKLIFDDYENYTSWIQDKKELYYDYDMRGKGAEDIHQNEAGHLVQSLIFKRQIT